MKLEICANSYQSAKNAQEAGAHRIELCQELTVGGMTPSYGLIKQIMDTLSIPVFVLIRPRNGNFTYTEEEFDIMKQDIQLCKNLGCTGIVSGVLNNDNTIDIERTKELVELSKPLQFTFHRAFDCTPNAFDALDALMGLDVSRILTSGQQPTAEAGIFMLKQLRKIADKTLIIMPGSGINANNVLAFKGVGFQEIHTSASAHIPTSNNNSFFGDANQTVSDLAVIKMILNNIQDEA